MLESGSDVKSDQVMGGKTVIIFHVHLVCVSTRVPSLSGLLMQKDNFSVAENDNTLIENSE